MWVALPNPRRQASRTCGVVFRLFRVHQRDKFGLWEACVYRDFIFHPMSNLLHLAFSFRQMQDDTRTKTVVFFFSSAGILFSPWYTAKSYSKPLLPQRANFYAPGRWLAFCVPLYGKLAFEGDHLLINWAFLLNSQLQATLSDEFQKRRHFPQAVFTVETRILCNNVQIISKLEEALLSHGFTNRGTFIIGFQ